MRIILALFLLAISLFNELSAQRNFTLYHLEGSPQTHYMNPSFRPGANVFFTMPALGMHSVGFSHSGFAPKHLLSEREQDDSLTLTPGVAVGKMADLNHINLDVQNEIMGFGFRFKKKNYLSFSVMNRMQFNVLYPRDLFQFVVDGNGREFLGERASFDGLGINLNSYLEYALGYSRVINEDLMVGMRLKLLSGLTNVHTNRSELGIFTDEHTFDWTVDGSFRVNSSNSLYFADTLDHDDELEKIYEYLYNFENIGVGVDLGGSYVINDRLLVSASMNDLGFIRWNSNTRNFTTNDVTYTFEGVDINQLLQDSLDVFDVLLDSLVGLVGQDENNDSYSTSLYTRFFVGGRYLITDEIGGTLLLYNEIVNGRYRAGLHAGVNAKLGQWLSASVNYGYYGRGWANLGGGFSLRGGPVQFYLGVDNIIPVFDQRAARNLHAVFGMGFMIGKPDKEKTPGSLKFQ